MEARGFQTRSELPALDSHTLVCYVVSSEAAVERPCVLLDGGAGAPEEREGYMAGGGSSGNRASIFGRLWSRFGEVARQLGIVHEHDVREALEQQEERRRAKAPHKKIGQILVEQGRMKDSHVDKVLTEQKKVEAKKKAAPKRTAKKKAKKVAKKAPKKKAPKKKAKKKVGKK